MKVAIIHVVGALVASLVLGGLTLFIAAWDQQRAQKRRLQEASIALGVTLATLDSDESLPRLLQYSSQRFSGELLRNRLSDLCGALRIAWSWFGNLLQVGIVVAVGWAMYSSGSENAVFMWSVPAVAFFCWVIGIAFSYACLLLTGRYPGEAKVARKAIAALIEQRGGLIAPGRAKPPIAAREN